MRYNLVIDLGSTGLKASVVDENGQVISIATEPIETIILPEGGAEQDANKWWEKALSASKQALKASQISVADILAVCCDSQFSVIVPVDRDAKPLMNAIHWFDSRGGKFTAKIMKGFPSVQGLGIAKALKWIRYTGLAPIDSGVDSLAHMLFIKNVHPQIYSRAHKFLEPVDYLTSRLTGQFTATQHTMALSMITSNQSWGTTSYCEPLIKETGMDPGKLPDLIGNDGIVGSLTASVAAELGLNPATQVTAGMLDNQAALIGSGIVENLEGMIYIGTSLNINGHFPRKKTDILNSIATIPGCLPQKYMLLCEQGLGGKCLDYFLNNIIWSQDPMKSGTVPDDIYDSVNETVKSIPAGSGNVLFLPWLNGALAPVENKHARGGFFNLSLDSTRAHMTRAIMEGVAFNNKAALKPVEKFMGKKIKTIKLAGGGASSDIWAQIYADVLELPVLQLKNPSKVTSVGTGLMGFVRLGHLKAEKIPELITIKKVFNPISENVPIYQKLYDQYCRIFKTNSSIFKALNKMNR